MIDPKLRSVFPVDFLWGASVASHQVEGGNFNQWTRWEHAHAAHLAETAQQRLGWLPIWDEVRGEATNPLNYVSGKGVDHYSLYQHDLELARTLQLNAMRGGIEWSRINPKEGVFDAKAIDHYNKYFSEMKKTGLEPFINLWHWTQPEWFEDKGGFAHGGNMKYWRDYVHTLAQNIDFSQFRYVITINEANSYSLMSYAAGEWPPNEKNPLTSWLVYRRLAKAHKIAYKILKAKWPHLQIGVAHQCNKIVGKDTVGRVFAAGQAWYWNWMWLKKAKYHDFIGFNYYFADYRTGKKLNLDISHEKPVSDLGWHMEPAGIEEVIMNISRRWPDKPIIVTENGLADMQDQKREWWIAETMAALATAIEKGARVQGYLHWSLLDNFEWAYGWWPKFGLIEVDRKTMKRTIRPSARKWAQWLAIVDKR